jgi:N-acetylmuramoyl-L-alanine amidase
MKILNTLFSSLLLVVCAMSLMSFTVVIDAGHGGNDAGAIGLVKGTQEKHLNLSVAKQLAAKIRATYPEVKVVLTRETDVFLPLQQRADIVNKNHADLFISIHTNAAENRKACGAETFILGTDRMEDNLDVAMRENAVMKLEADQTVYQGFDPNSIESYIIFELMQNQYMDRSLEFAELVQNQFVGTLQRANRGVRQAAFWVLLKSACPSVLVEMGFVSNAEEEKWLASEEGKKGIVNGIFNAFENYYKK